MSDEEVGNESQSAEVYSELKDETDLEKKSEDELALVDGSNIMLSKDMYKDVKKDFCKCTVYNGGCYIFFTLIVVSVLSLFSLLYYFIMKERFFEILISYVVVVGLRFVEMLFLYCLPCIYGIFKKYLRK